MINIVVQSARQFRPIIFVHIYPIGGFAGKFLGKQNFVLLLILLCNADDATGQDEDDRESDSEENESGEEVLSIVSDLSAAGRQLQIELGDTIIDKGINPGVNNTGNVQCILVL